MNRGEPASCEQFPDFRQRALQTDSVISHACARIQADGTDARIEVFDGLGHGFGLGEGTVAEGWINNAVDFWEQNME